MIRGKSLKKSFGGNQVVDGLDINVKKGSIYGIVGENGCGKSTVMKMLNGVYQSDEGEVLIEGEVVSHHSREKIFYMSENVFHFYSYTVKDMAGFYSKMYESFSWEKFRGLKENFKFSMDQKIRNLSKGQKKQAMFWIGFAVGADIMILDEPLDGLDPKIRSRLKGILIEETADREMTTIISSHNLPELEGICDHIGIMDGGKIIVEKDIDELKDSIHKIQYISNVEEESLKSTNNIKVISTEKKTKGNVALVKGSYRDIEEFFEDEKFIYYDIIPLTLEEIFISELEEREYEHKKIIGE